MTSNLGVYYAPAHTLPQDMDYIRKLQPSVLRIFEPDVQMIADMHALVPGAIICPRTWAIDDGSDPDHPSRQVNRINADPIATAIDHANQYAGQLAQWKQQAHDRGLTLPADDHIYFNSANEPNQGGELDKIAAYAVAFLNHCTELGLRATAPCLGVGWPNNTGEGTPVDWSAYTNAGLEQAIKRGSHWLELHEYFDKSGPQLNWTWWAGRHLQCPLDVPILLGEIGMDNFVNGNWSKEPEATRGNRGWIGNVTPDQYGDMIEWHISHSDTRVVAGLVFITDIRNKQWESFNTRGAHGAFLARKDVMVPQTPPKTDTPPVVTPPIVIPPPTGDTWRRSIDWVLEWEGGFQNDPRDNGNWTGCETGVGANKGTNFGISTCSYPDLDIVNLTKEQAVAIYERDYWTPSGADKLPWPACLIVFDTAVLHGVGAAKQWLAETGANPYAFASKRLNSYTHSSNWIAFGAGWTNRTADLLLEASK